MMKIDENKIKANKLEVRFKAFMYLYAFIRDLLIICSSNIINLMIW